MQTTIIKNPVNNNSNNPAILKPFNPYVEQALYTTQTVNNNVNLAAETILRFLQSNKDTQLSIREYTQISTTIYKLASAQKKVVNVIKVRNNPAQAPNLKDSLNHSIKLATESFFCFLRSNQNALFTPVEYNQLCSIIQKFAAANTVLINVNQNPDVTSILHSIIGFVSDHFNQFYHNHKRVLFTLDELNLLTSITQKLASALSQVAKHEILEIEPKSKETSNNHPPHSQPTADTSAYQNIHTKVTSQPQPNRSANPQPKRN